MPDHKILSRRLNYFLGHGRQGVDVENPLDLRQERIQQPEVAAGDPDDRSSSDRINRSPGIPAALTTTPGQFVAAAAPRILQLGARLTF